MASRSVEELKRDCGRYWVGEEMSRACASTIDLIVRSEVFHEFTIRTVVDQARLTIDPGEVYKLLQFLTEEPARLLVLQFLFIDDRDERFPLEPSELKAAYDSGFLVHPEDGAHVENFEEYVVPVFVPSPRLTDIRQRSKPS